jgi:trimethylamine:corrinoid methyltransferase-like protein
VNLENSAADPVALIQEGVQAGTFLGVDDTVANFRSFYYFPDIFRHWNLGRWQSEGAPALLDEAWARARAEIAKATFALSDEQAKEVDRIYAKAQQHVLNKK